MSRLTRRSRSDHTWRPWDGCGKESALKQPSGHGRDLGPLRRTRAWKDVERWDREAERAGRTDRVFVCPPGDFFHEGADAWRPEAWDLIRRCRHLQFQILTKRPLLVRDRLPPDWGAGYPNVWLGVGIESNDYAWRADVLREIPARVRWVSAEPLLGPLPDLDLTGFRWVVVGGESGPGYRDMAHCWARQLRDRAKAQGVAFYFKQSAGARPGRGDLLDGRRWHEFPPTPERSDETAAGRPVERDPDAAGEDGQEGRKTEGVRTDEERESEHLNATPEQARTLADSLPRTAEAKAVLSATWEETRSRVANHTEECQLNGHAGCQLLTPSVLSVELPTIPTCCLEDCLERAAWWSEIENQLETMVDKGLVTDAPVPWYPDGRRHCLAGLARKVPYPTPGEWDEYRVRTEARLRQQEGERQHEELERRRRQQEMAHLRGELQRQRQETERVGAHWQSRFEREKKRRVKAEQAAGRWRTLAGMAQRDAAAAWKLYQDLAGQAASPGFAGQAGSGAVPRDVQQALAVLGLQWPCTREEVKAAYRALAKQHHPDRGGDPEDFKKVEAAHKRVLEMLDQLGVP